jgi:hypothetical protein
MTEKLVRMGQEYDNLKAKNDIGLDKVNQIDSDLFDDLVKLRTLYGQLSNIDNVKTTFESLKKQFKDGKISAEEYK